MRAFLGTLALLTATAPALADGTFGVPAPLIGAGIPVAIVVGATFLVSKLLRRRR